LKGFTRQIRGRATLFGQDSRSEKGLDPGTGIENLPFRALKTRSVAGTVGGVGGPRGTGSGSQKSEKNVPKFRSCQAGKGRDSAEKKPSGRVSDTARGKSTKKGPQRDPPGGNSSSERDRRTQRARVTQVAGNSQGRFHRWGAARTLYAKKDRKLGMKEKNVGGGERPINPGTNLQGRGRKGIEANQVEEKGGGRITKPLIEGGVIRNGPPPQQRPRARNGRRGDDQKFVSLWG